MPVITPHDIHENLRALKRQTAMDTIVPKFAGKILDIRSKESSEDSNASRILPYTHGLAGVKLALDQELTGYLWWSIAIFILAIVFARVVQLFNNHFRHLNALAGRPSDQNYWVFDKTTSWPWFKKNVLYAPLWKKRHNREYRLSEALNMGTLPSRFHTIILTLYVISNLAYTLLLDYKNPDKASVFAELRGRSGILATVNMVPLVLLAGRNNPLVHLLKVSFDTFNLIHRWLGRLVALEALIHTFAWACNNIRAKGFSAAMGSISGNNFLAFGLVSTISMVIIVIQASSIVRHAFYETFLHLHQLLAFLAILGLYIHLEVAKLPAFPYIRLVVAIWAIERLLRLSRLLYLNVSRTNGCTQVRVEALAGEACRVTFHLPRHITIRPGSHVYAYLPQISLWMSHPFSVAWTDTSSEPPTGLRSSLDSSPPLTPSSLEKALPTPTTPPLPRSHPQSTLPAINGPAASPPTSISLITAARTGMTRKLYNLASSAPNQTLLLSSPIFPSLLPSGLLEGPYSGHDSLRSYGTVILFAGGAGITHHLIQIRHLLASSVAGTVATQKITLIWSVKSVEMLSWVRPWMDEILALPGRRERLTIKLFVTKPKSPREVKSPSQTVLMFPGRCRPAAVLDEEWEARVGAVGVSVCGPGAFADEVRAAVRERVGWGTVDFWEEGFTW